MTFPHYKAVENLLPGLALVACLALSGPLAAQAPESVRELQFGDALFYFYQDDYFTAMTRMGAALERGELSYHGEEAELLMGGMHLAYGQHRRAEAIFTRLLDSQAGAVRDRAWFYLARLRFQRGFYAESSDALARIEDELDDKLEPLRRQLAVQLLMQQNEYARAAELLEKNALKGNWAAFMQFNLGVALIRAARFEEGEAVLARLGERRAHGEEMRALRDRANITRAFSLLQRAEPDAARAALNTVRLEGPYSNKALLAAAWADIAQDRFRAALVPLQVLGSREPRDVAVQEGLLAQPYALASLKASRQAAEAYELAIGSFSAESARLSASMDAIRNGDMISALLADGEPERMGWFWHPQNIGDAPEGRYLYELMADHAFQENLKNYRDLLFLRKNLARWAENIGAYDDMLALSRRAHTERLPGIKERYARMDLSLPGKRVTDLQARLDAARADEEPFGLANQSELRQLQKIAALEKQLAGLPEEQLRIRQSERLQRLRGVMLFEIQAQRSERLWQLSKALDNARSELDAARAGAVRLARAIDEAPKRFSGFETRIDDAHNRLLGLNYSLEQLLARQAAALNETAVTVLTERKEVLDAFALQARFALAAVYDRAGAAEGAP